MPGEPPERWNKLAREALKQCGRAWLPRFTGNRTPEEAGMVLLQEQVRPRSLPDARKSLSFSDGMPSDWEIYLGH